VEGRRKQRDASQYGAKKRREGDSRFAFVRDVALPIKKRYGQRNMRSTVSNIMPDCWKL